MLSKLGALHVVLNNAGVVPHATLWRIISEQADLLFATNVKGIIFGLKHQPPATRKNNTKE